jgi:hypothetical protein
MMSKLFKLHREQIIYLEPLHLPQRGIEIIDTLLGVEIGVGFVTVPLFNLLKIRRIYNTMNY